MKWSEEDVGMYQEGYFTKEGIHAVSRLSFYISVSTVYAQISSRSAATTLLSVLINIRGPLSVLTGDVNELISGV